MRLYALFGCFCFVSKQDKKAKQGHFGFLYGLSVASNAKNRPEPLGNRDAEHDEPDAPCCYEHSESVSHVPSRSF